MNASVRLACPGGDGRELQAELHRPEGAGPHPVVLLIPGGGWRICDPSHLAHWGQWLAAQGFAALCIPHATSTSHPGGALEAALADVRAALTHVMHSAGVHGLDSQRIALLGESSGATIAALVALTQGGVAEQAPACPRVQALAGIYGTYDMAARWRSQLTMNEVAGMGLCRSFLGMDLYENRQRYFDASPCSHVSYEACRNLKVLLAWGDNDPIAPAHEQSESFARQLREARNPVQTFTVGGAGHFWFQTDPVEEPGSPNAFLAPRLNRFLRAALGAKR